MTAFFEKSHKDTRTKIKKEPAGSFLFGYRRRTRTHGNATVRWTAAEFRLDGIHTLIQSSPVARTQEVARTGNSDEAEIIAAFADILLAFPDLLRYNETVIRRKGKEPDITEKVNGRNLK